MDVVRVDGSNTLIGDRGEVLLQNSRIVAIGSIPAPEISPSGDETVAERGDEDIITAGDGNNWIMGGLGSDTITAGSGQNFIMGDLGEMEFEFDFGVGVNRLTLMQTRYPALGASDAIQVGSGRNYVVAGIGVDVGHIGSGYLIFDGAILEFSAGEVRRSEVVQLLRDVNNPEPPFVLLDNVLVQVTASILDLFTGELSETGP